MNHLFPQLVESILGADFFSTSQESTGMESKEKPHARNTFVAHFKNSGALNSQTVGDTSAPTPRRPPVSQSKARVGGKKNTSRPLPVDTPGSREHRGGKAGKKVTFTSDSHDGQRRPLLTSTPLGTGSDTPTKRGRGRPRKDSTPGDDGPRRPLLTSTPLGTAETPTKRGRGRPRKDSTPGDGGPRRPLLTSTPLGTADTPTKRGRGRPRKDTTPGEKTPSKKGGGRGEQGTPLKKGRGRPSIQAAPGAHTPSKTGGSADVGFAKKKSKFPALVVTPGLKRGPSHESKKWAHYKRNMVLLKNIIEDWDAEEETEEELVGEEEEEETD